MLSIKWADEFYACIEDAYNELRSTDQKSIYIPMASTYLFNTELMSYLYDQIHNNTDVPVMVKKTEGGINVFLRGEDMSP